MSPSLTDKLLSWYEDNQRNLPWRATKDPYAVWVSEIMLQQTRVETVLPYYERWMERYPTVADLAAASQQEVLSSWEGLGYYSRARNLHRAAQILVETNGGELPRDVDELLALPGIGRYTAGAIASLAFGLDEPVVDGNVKRVLARVFDVEAPIDTAAGERRMWQLAAEHLPDGRAGEYNQALMELGATLCKPRKPQCRACPLRDDCKAFRLGQQESRPVRGPKVSIPERKAVAAVIQRRGRVLLSQHPQRGLLGGMWQFPGSELSNGEALRAGLSSEMQEQLGSLLQVGEKLGVYRHAYTHFRVQTHAFRCVLTAGIFRPPKRSLLRWVRLKELADYPMGKVARQIANDLVLANSPRK